MKSKDFQHIEGKTQRAREEKWKKKGVYSFTLRLRSFFQTGEKSCFETHICDHFLIHQPFTLRLRRYRGDRRTIWGEQPYESWGGRRTTWGEQTHESERRRCNLKEDFLRRTTSISLVRGAPFEDNSAWIWRWETQPWGGFFWGEQPHESGSERRTIGRLTTASVLRWEAHHWGEHDSCPLGVSIDLCPAGAPWLRE